ncbi:TPA: hypothetical protein HNI58_22345 [Escherichia coli]
MSIKNDGHYFCRAGGNRPDGLNEPVTFFHRDPKNIIVGNAVPEPSGWPDDIVDSRTGTGGLNGKLFRF